MTLADVRRALRLSALLWFGAVGTTHALPEGSAEFLIESPGVSSALGENLEATRAEISRALADAARRSFAFINWTTDNEQAQFGLRLRLVDAPDGGNCQPNKLLVLEAFLVNEPQPATDPVLAFDGCNPEPLYTFEQLDPFKAKIEDHIDELTGSAKGYLMGRVLSRVAVGNQLAFDHQARRAVFPMRLTDLGLGEASRLKVEFNRDGTVGKLFFLPFAQIDAGIQCKFTRFEFPPDIDIDEEFHWNDSFTQVFPPDEPVPLNVFITEYEPNLHGPSLTFDESGLAVDL